MPPKFIYFDLGKVVLDFSVERMCRQIGELVALDPGRVQEAIFDSHLQARYERGEVTTQEFFEAFCRLTGTTSDCVALVLAASDIFELNESILPVIVRLKEAGYRMGILSNTCQGHWEHCLDRFPILREAFQIYALSYELKAAKPDPAIYRAAAALAGVKPEEIFYTDDIPANVEGARAAGLDAVLYTSTPQLVEELQKRGVDLRP